MLTKENKMVTRRTIWRPKEEHVDKREQNGYKKNMVARTIW